jgi:hypothetical protein
MRGRADAEDASCPSAVDPDRLVLQFGKALQGLSAFQLVLHVVTEVETDGTTREFSSTALLALQRPDKVAMVHKQGAMGSTLICDGERTFTYVPAMRSYTEQKAPERLETLSGQMGISMKSALPVVRFLVSANPLKAIMERVLRVRYIGADTIDEVDCHRLRFEQEQFTWDGWLSSGDPPLLLKIVPDFSGIFAEALASGGEDAPKDFRYTMSYHLQDWDVDPAFPTNRFAFVPPEGVQKVDSFFGGQAPPREPEKREQQGGGPPE